MLELLLAAAAVVAPVGAEVARTDAAPTDAARVEAPPARVLRVDGIRVGKRCHPDPTKSKSCREVLPDRKSRSEAALADAR